MEWNSMILESELLKVPNKSLLSIDKKEQAHDMRCESSVLFLQTKTAI